MREVFLKKACAGIFLFFLSAQSAFAAATAPAAVEAADIPMGQSSGGEVSLLPEDVGNVQGDENLFGSEGGYFHPYITLDFEYTDNLYNIDVGETTNWLTRVSPGIWFALPRKKIIPITLNPNNTSPGGLQNQFKDYEGTDRFQAYALGGLDFKNYSDDSDLNGVNGIAEGMARYNMRGGLSLQLVDRYSHDENKFDIGTAVRSQLRAFDSNFLMATADWDLTEKLRVQFDYFNFALGYEDGVNDFMDRVDNGFNLYGYYNYSLKTSFFLEYKYVDVAYDQSVVIDNNSNFFYGGLTWNTTEKLALLAKIGYQNKKYDDVSLGQQDFDGFVYDLQASYRFSEKSLFEFDMYRMNEETDTSIATDKTVLGASAKYTQKFTEKISATVDAGYEDAEYTSVSNFFDRDRDDKTFAVKPGVQYLFREWLMFELSYKYELRDSTIKIFDYTSNTVFISATLAM